MAPKWTFEYYNGATWVAFSAKLQMIDELLNDHEEAQINIPNTASNQTFVSSDKTVQIKYNGAAIFSGALVPIEMTPTSIRCVLYNAVYEAMKSKTITADYSAGVQADTILGAICTAAGVTAGTCPTTTVAVRFDDAYCYDAALFLADCLNQDHYSTLGTTFNIAARGSAKSITNYNVRSRALDRAKLRDKVRVKGVDADGLAIVGEAGTGTKVAVYREKKASNVATLNTLASKYLARLNTESKGAPIQVPIEQAYALYPGDTLSLTNARYSLSGTQKIMRIKKQPAKATLQLERLMSSLEDKILDARKYADLGIYQVQPNQLTPWALNTSGLVGLYHLTDGTVDDTATRVKDSSESAADGDVTNGFWVAGSIPGTKVLNFDATGYVDCTDEFDVGGKTTASLGIWFSPEDHFADANYLIGKSGQIALQHYGTDDRVRFGVYVGDAWHWVASDANIAPLYGRNFAMGVYDGANLHLFINGILHKTAAQSGAIDASSAITYIGALTSMSGYFHGVVTEAMMWVRALSAQEVQELYFFPLARLIGKNEFNLPAGAYLAIGTEVKPRYTLNLDYLLDELIVSGTILISSVGGTMNSYEAGYALLALMDYGGSSYYSQVEDILDFWATLQNADGSWYQQYNPYVPYDEVADLKVDSGCALICWAMSHYDALTSGTQYKTNVQAGMGFLRDLQYAHDLEYSTALIANLIYNGTTDAVALLADCAECLLSMKTALQTYGADLLTTAGYSVNLMAARLYYYITNSGFHSDVKYYDTSFPWETNTEIPFTYKEKISYTQALCAWANKVFAASDLAKIVMGVVMTTFGAGYDNPPSVVIVGDGSNATAHAHLIPSIIPYCDVTNGGSGYTAATVDFSGGGGAGAAAYCTIVGGAVTAVIMTNYGSGYTSRPNATVNGDGVGATVLAHLNTGVNNIDLDNFGSGYTTATVNIGAPEISPGTQATATASLAADQSAQCENCLDYINTVTRGTWGGEMYCPYNGAVDETKDEFAGYAGLMAIALNIVNSTKYAAMIAGLKSVLKWMALDDGRIYDCVDADGKLWRSKIAPFGGSPTEGEFLLLPIAMALLAEAGV